MGNLITELGRWIWNGARPSDWAWQYLTALARGTYIWCPIIAIPFMLIGLHLWVYAFAVAGIIGMIPVLLYETMRRLAKDFPLLGGLSSEVISNLATPHTWLMALSFWLIILQPEEGHRWPVYIILFGIALFITMSGRWGYQPKWYKPAAKLALFTPVVHLICLMIISAASPEFALGLEQYKIKAREGTAVAVFGKGYEQIKCRTTTDTNAFRVEADGSLHAAVVGNDRQVWRLAKEKFRILRDGRRYYACYLESNRTRNVPDPGKGQYLIPGEALDIMN